MAARLASNWCLRRERNGGRYEGCDGDEDGERDGRGRQAERKEMRRERDGQASRSGDGDGEEKKQRSTANPKGGVEAAKGNALVRFQRRSWGAYEGR